MLRAVIILNCTSLTGTVGILDDVYCSAKKKPVKKTVKKKT